MVWTGYEVDAKAPLHVIVDGQEYDLTAWKNYHPGGHFILHQCALTTHTIIMKLFHSSLSLSNFPSVQP